MDNNLKQKKLDRVILVDKNDNIIGEMDKIEAHKGEGQLHRASSVYLFRKNKTLDQVEILVQQRSQHKIVGAHQWGNAVCGNVRPGESYEECGLRRLKEEIGVRGVKIQDIFSFMYKTKCNNEFSEHELDHVFVGQYEGRVALNPQEAQDYLWIRWDDLMEKVKKLALVEYKPYGENIEVKSDRGIVVINFNPWTLIMLNNADLIEKIRDFLSKMR